MCLSLFLSVYTHRRDILDFVYILLDTSSVFIYVFIHLYALKCFKRISPFHHRYNALQLLLLFLVFMHLLRICFGFSNMYVQCMVQREREKETETDFLYEFNRSCHVPGSHNFSFLFIRCSNTDGTERT